MPTPHFCPYCGKMTIRENDNADGSNTDTYSNLLREEVYVSWYFCSSCKADFGIC